QVGDRLDLIDARVPQAVSSMEISRAADRLIAATPALLAAATKKERDEISIRIRPPHHRAERSRTWQQRRRDGGRDPAAGRLVASEPRGARGAGGAKAGKEREPF